MSQDPHLSPSGVPIQRHESTRGDSALTPTDAAARETWLKHLAKRIAKPAPLPAARRDDVVRIELFRLPPAKKRPFHTIVTFGMSDRAMRVPEGAEPCRYAELMIGLPPDWPLPPELDDRRHAWPLELLEVLGRFPHVYDTWLFPMHTIPNGNPPQAFAQDTQLCGSLISLPMSLPPAARACRVRPEKTIHLYSVVPLHAREMQFKLDEGTEPLLRMLEERGVREMLDVARPCVLDG